MQQMFSVAFKFLERTLGKRAMAGISVAVAFISIGAYGAINYPDYVVTPEVLQEKISVATADMRYGQAELELQGLQSQKFEVEEKYYTTPKNSPMYQRYKDRLDKINARIKVLDSIKTVQLKIMKGETKGEK